MGFSREQGRTVGNGKREDNVSLGQGIGGPRSRLAHRTDESRYGLFN